MKIFIRIILFVVCLLFYLSLNLGIAYVDGSFVLPASPFFSIFFFTRIILALGLSLAMVKIFNLQKFWFFALLIPIFFTYHRLLLYEVEIRNERFKKEFERCYELESLVEPFRLELLEYVIDSVEGKFLFPDEMPPIKLHDNEAILYALKSFDHQTRKRVWDIHIVFDGFYIYCNANEDRRFGYQFLVSPARYLRHRKDQSQAKVKQ